MIITINPDKVFKGPINFGYSLLWFLGFWGFDNSILENKIIKYVESSTLRNKIRVSTSRDLPAKPSNNKITFYQLSKLLPFFSGCPTLPITVQTRNSYDAIAVINNS